jgi:hypothetical protein
VDDRLRELLRRFDTEPTTSVADELSRAHAQVGQPAPRAVLRRTTRWLPLVDFVARWYARPLADEDGCSDEEVVEAEARLGAPMPGALREWHRLVGRRLQRVSMDRRTFVSLDALSRARYQLDVPTGQVAVWDPDVEPWSVPLSSGEDDPLVTRAGERAGALAEMLVAAAGPLETLAHAAYGHRAGPFGPLGAEVRGGDLEDDDLQEYPGYSTLPGEWTRLGVSRYSEPRGDADTVIQPDTPGFLWMTRTVEAGVRLARALEPITVPEAYARFLADLGR